MNQSLEQHVAHWWEIDCQVEQLKRRMTELRHQQAQLASDQCLAAEQINQATVKRESMVFAVASDTYVVLAWQEYSEDFTIELLEEIR